MANNPTTSAPTRMLTFRGGGWVLLLAGLISLALTTWALWPAITRAKSEPVAETPDDYGFNLTQLTVPKSELTVVLPRADFLPVWDHPPLVPDDAISDQIHFGHAKYLVSTDRVIGVTIQGQSRAYPLSLLNVHEIINDTLADTPIAVTYHLWCDSAVVFIRTLAGHPIELASSGMVMDSNLIMFDRRVDRQDSSLFRQLTGKPIAGPAVDHDDSLTILPCALTTWADWHTLHPDTSVIGWNDELSNRYEGSNPDQYFQSDKLEFHPDPLPPTDALAYKDRVMAVSVAGARRVYPQRYMERHVDAQGLFRDTIGTTPIEIQIDPVNHCAALITPAQDDDVHVIYAFWFAWFAVYGDADVVGLDEIRSAGAVAPRS